ncbi:MAG: hypothetical protein M3365_05415 [Gemmatimonadota bacterium]|nr:hypothetical protein [Gemmatimonadota bacterium]
MPDAAMAPGPCSFFLRAPQVLVQFWVAVDVRRVTPMPSRGPAERQRRAFVPARIEHLLHGIGRLANPSPTR